MLDNLDVVKEMVKKDIDNLYAEADNFIEKCKVWLKFNRNWLIASGACLVAGFIVGLVC